MVYRRSIKGANGETFSQLLLLQLLHHHTSKAIYIHHNDNIEEKYGLLANILRHSDQTPVDDRCRNKFRRCRNKFRCLSRVCKFFHCAANTLIFSGFEAKNVKASGAPPQAPMGELTALPHTPLLVSGWAPPPAAPPTNRPPYSPIPRSATQWSRRPCVHCMPIGTQSFMPFTHQPFASKTSSSVVLYNVGE